MSYKDEIVKIINVDGLSEEEICNNIEIPKDLTRGDYAIPCFKFAKTLKQSPNKIAETIIKNIKDENKIFSEITNINGFLNFKINTQKLIDDVINEILLKNECYGKDNSGNGKVICIDYSSINIAKPFHIGHLLSTVIGSALYKVYKKLGYKPVGINHLGDWGTQFGALITAYKAWGNEKEIEEQGIQALSKYYVRFHKVEREQQEQIAKENGIKEEEIGNIQAPIREEARHWFKKIEDHDLEAINIFSRFKDITLSEIKKTYKRLNVEFDSYKGESFYNDKMDAVVEELSEKGLIQESQGAQVIKFENENGEEYLPLAIVKRSDGASLYFTRDLAAAFYRNKFYNFEKCLYVVAYQQHLHFEQLFETIKKMGYDWSSKMKHVEFGMVSLESGSMSTRQGNIVLLEDVLNTSVEKSKKIIEEKNPDLLKKDKIAEQVGVGAVIFAALKNSRIKDMVFSYDRMLSFEGETAPYIQYTYARCCSIIRKSEYLSEDVSESYTNLNNPEGREICLKLSMYNDTLHQVIEKDEPSILARYVIDIAKLFNKFYTNYKILSENKLEREERVMLVMAVKEVIHDSMELLGIECPSIM